MDTSKYDFPQKAGIIFSMAFTSSYHFRECPKQGTTKIRGVRWGGKMVTSTIPSATSGERLCGPCTIFYGKLNPFGKGGVE